MVALQALSASTAHKELGLFSGPYFCPAVESRFHRRQADPCSYAVVGCRECSTTGQYGAHMKTVRTLDTHVRTMQPYRPDEQVIRVQYIFDLVKHSCQDIWLDSQKDNFRPRHHFRVALGGKHAGSCMPVQCRLLASDGRDKMVK